MSTERIARWLTLFGLVPLVGLAAPPASPPTEAQAALQAGQARQAGQLEGLRARLLRHEPSAVRSLDPAIFVEISPVAVTEPAVRLPDDQRDDE